MNIDCIRGDRRGDNKKSFRNFDIDTELYYL